MTRQLFCLTFLKNVFSIHHISDRRRCNTFNEEEKNLTQKVYTMFSSMFSNATNNCEYLNKRKDGDENDPMETISREFDREDIVAKLERECEALEDMEKKYQEELKEKKHEEEEKKATLEKEMKKAREREEELRHLQEEMNHQEAEICRLREELKRETFEHLREKEEKRRNRVKLLEEYEKLASQMEEIKKYPEEIKKEEEKMRLVEARLRKMCEGKFVDVKIETFEDFGKEMNAHFDRVIAKEKDLERRTVLAANELLTKKSGAFAHNVDDRKRKEPEEQEEEEEEEKGEEKEEIEPTTPLDDTKD